MKGLVGGPLLVGGLGPGPPGPPLNPALVCNIYIFWYSALLLDEVKFLPLLRILQLHLIILKIKLFLSLVCKLKLLHYSHS